MVYRYLVAHGCDLHIFECDSEQQALSVAAADYGELIIQSVVSHNGNPDKLGKLFFTVTFTDDPSVITTLPYKEVKYVQVVRNYINKHKDVLRTAAADLRKQETVTPTKRVKRISQALEGFEHWSSVLLTTFLVRLQVYGKECNSKSPSTFL